MILSEDRARSSPFVTLSSQSMLATVDCRVRHSIHSCFRLATLTARMVFASVASHIDSNVSECYSCRYIPINSSAATVSVDLLQANNPIWSIAVNKLFTGESIYLSKRSDSARTLLALSKYSCQPCALSEGLYDKRDGHIFDFHKIVSQPW